MTFARLLAVIISWTLLLGLAVYFFFDNVVAYLYGYRSPNFGNTIFNNQLWVVLHLVGGTLALFLGPLQFLNYIRNKNIRLHRLLGKVYIAGVVLTGLSALRMALVSRCEPCRVSLFLLAVFALLATYFAWKTIKARNIKAHRQFMIRSYVLIFSFVAVRIDDILPLDFLFGTIKDGTFRRVANEYFFSFVPLLVTEICITWLPAAKTLKKKPVDSKPLPS